MKYLIIAFLSAAIALINALRISSPAGGENLIIGNSYRVTWSDHKGLGDLFFYLVDLTDSPPFYLLLKKRDSNEKESHIDIVIPHNTLPGTYQLQITGRNPYNVHDTSSKIKLSYRELGPTPDESPAPDAELEPTVEPGLDECPEECTECDEECNECNGEPVCDDGEDDHEHDDGEDEHDHDGHNHGHDHEHNKHDHKPDQEEDDCEDDDDTDFEDTGSGKKDGAGSNTDDSGSGKKEGASSKTHDSVSGKKEGTSSNTDDSDKKTALPSVGSMNIVTGFWLIIMIAISSILFL